MLSNKKYNVSITCRIGLDNCNKSVHLRQHCKICDDGNKFQCLTNYISDDYHELTITKTLYTSLRSKATMVEYDDAKLAIVGAEVVLSLTVNTFVIAVLTRYSQLREDRTALFMLSISAADLATGCIVMPIGAAVCSRITPSILDELKYLPKINVFAMWWFGFVSLYSLCWMTISKAVAIIKPFRSEQLLSRKRCYIIIALTWIIGFVFATIYFKLDLTWNTNMCTSRYPHNFGLNVFYLAYFVVAAVLPRIVLVYCTGRIFIVVLRTHRQVAAQAQSIATCAIGSTNQGVVTYHAIRSSINVLVICFVSIVLTTPLFVCSILSNATRMKFPTGLGFTALWMFQLNTIINSLLYVLLFRSVRKKINKAFNEILTYIRGN